MEPYTQATRVTIPLGTLQALLSVGNIREISRRTGVPRHALYRWANEGVGPRIAHVLAVQAFYGELMGELFAGSGEVIAL